MRPIDPESLPLAQIERNYAKTLKGANTLGARAKFWASHSGNYLPSGDVGNNQPASSSSSSSSAASSSSSGHAINNLGNENGPNNLGSMNDWFATVNQLHALRIASIIEEPTIVKLNTLIHDIFPTYIGVPGEAPRPETGPSVEPFTLPAQFGTVDSLTGIQAMKTEDDGDCGVHTFLNATCGWFRRLSEDDKSDMVKYCRIELFPKLIVKFGADRGIGPDIFYDRFEIQQVTGKNGKPRDETTLESFARHMKESKPYAKSNLFLTNEEVQALFRLFQESMCCLVVHISNIGEMRFHVYSFEIEGKDTCFITTNVGPTYNLRQVNHFMSCTINGSYTMPVATARLANEELQERYPEGGRPIYVANTKRNAEIARLLAEDLNRENREERERARLLASKKPSAKPSSSSSSSSSASSSSNRPIKNVNEIVKLFRPSNNFGESNRRAVARQLVGQTPDQINTTLRNFGYRLGGTRKARRRRNTRRH
jgi:hypothetical protein